MDETDSTHCILTYWAFGTLIRNIRRTVANTKLPYILQYPSASTSLFGDTVLVGLGSCKLDPAAPKTLHSLYNFRARKDLINWNIF
jgi:hypothetical protein